MIRCAYADTALGQLHYAECGTGPPVLLLHQTPRSHDEFRDVLPRLAAAGRRAIAMDTMGFGRSAPPPPEPSIADYAAGAWALLDALELRSVDVVGHHTGGVIAVELAAGVPDRIRAVVLSSTPYIGADARAARAGRPPIDDVAVRDDGAHLTVLWRRRQAFYPSGRPDLLTRFVRDALTAVSPEAGHRAVSRYHMEDRLPRWPGPVLLIGADADPYAFGDLDRLRAALPHAAVTVLPGGGVPLPDQLPAAFASAVVDFLRSLDEEGR